MKVSFDKSFQKRLIKIKDKDTLEKIRQAIMQAESATDIRQISNFKKMEGFKYFYRIKVGDHRIGVELKKDTLWFITVANRKDIYKNFP